jgi:hypothetical protein
VHHVLPVSWPRGVAHELDPSNLITLCGPEAHHCHLMVGHLGDYHSRNPNVVNDAARMLAKIESRPYPK